MRVVTTNADGDNQHFEEAAVAFTDEGRLLILDDENVVLAEFDNDQWLQALVINE